MRGYVDTTQELLHLTVELDRACSLLFDTRIGISREEVRILLELNTEQQAIRPGILAKSLGLQPSLLSRVLRQLEAKGYIARHRTKGDARILLLSLTEEGCSIANELAEEFGAYLFGLCQHAGLEHPEQLVDALSKAVHYTEDYLVSRDPALS